jgi:hypothetical protein
VICDHTDEGLVRLVVERICLQAATG